MKILIVEDDIAKSTDINFFLNRNGVLNSDLTIIDNVHDAVAMLRTVKFDILLLDLNLPLRKNEFPVAEGGTKILFRLTSPYFLTPTYVMGLTQFDDISEIEKPNFQKLDFNIYNYERDYWRDVLASKLNWIKRNSTSVDSRETSEKIVVLTHGIMTSGAWHEKVAEVFKGKPYKVIPFKYPHYPAFKILLKSSRNRIIESYIDFIIKICQDHPNAELSFISHSFGTFMTIHALSSRKLLYPPKIDTIILCGSVIQQDFDIPNFIDTVNAKRLVNDCAYNDKALLFCNMICFGLGHGGRIGFNGYHEKLINRYFKGGHSCFFKGNEHIEKHWFQSLNVGKFEVIDGRDFNPMREGYESLVNVISPIIKFFYIPALLALITIFFISA
ncbi:hypothetical protein [Pantoea agglomerans]|uniref:hypothetical protein n=1 Tax=Enterobacter agglomerans TaxID=549 RepID=UPI003C7C812C